MGQRLANAPTEVLYANWNGRRLEGRVGDTVAAALYAAGFRTFGRSRKYHEPRGLSGSFMAGHLATVDGLPRVRLDRAPLVEGCDIRMHGAWPSPNLDLLCAAQWVPRRLLWAGFEHPRAVPDQSVLWRPWERCLALAAGEVTAPAGGTEIEGRRMRAETVVIGGGDAGQRAAVEAGAGTVLVERNALLENVIDGITILDGHDVFALYDNGFLVAAAPFDHTKPAVLIDTENVVLATGTRSIPPLVRGAALPGVLDAATALRLAEVHGVPAGENVVVVGTHGKEDIAERLRSFGIHVARVLAVETVKGISGHTGVRGIDTTDGAVACDAIVHAGPWRPDPSLRFQAGWQGELRLEAGAMPSNLRIVGDAADSPEPIPVSAEPDRRAYVCPCMDVTVGEILHHIEHGVTHVEELKRLTGCGMGPCQGLPCWELLAAVVASRTGETVDVVGHPTYRPPKAALTFGQAAGLADLTEVAE